MVRSSKKRRRFIDGLMLAAVIGLAFCLVFHFDLFHKIHLQSGDFFYRAVNSDPGAGSDSEITIVAIDDKSLDQLGKFSSWPREYHARLIDTLATNEARIIAFDILFSEPTDDDDELAAAMQRAGNVILPFAGKLAVSSPDGGDVTAEGVIRPLAIFEESATATGHSIMVPDEDGIVRRLPLITRSGEGYEPALSLAAIARYLRRPQIIEATPEASRLSFAGRSIPLDSNGNMLINFKLSPSYPSSFTMVPYADVLNDNFNPDDFRDRIVLIGATAIGLGDTFWTPMGWMTSGVQLHAGAMQTILSGSFLKTPPVIVTMLSIILLAVLCGLAVLRLRVLWATLTAICLALIYFLTAFYFFDRGLQLDMLYPPLAIAGAFTGVTLYNYASERREKSEITKTFGRYVSPSIAKTILDAIDRGSLKLGGEERTVTVLFADARNFTGISEKMNTQLLVSVLNRYLSEIIRATLQYEGMVNKFGGDSIMAIWNVPVACQRHALLATTAAVRAQQAIRELQEKASHLPRMEFGIGINTGRVVAGNMGSADRLEYSVIGDAVNTAARLAGAAPGGKVWIGEDAYELIKDQIRAAPLEPQSLKGKQEAIQVYEVLDIQPSDGQEKTLHLIHEGRRASNHESG